MKFLSPERIFFALAVALAGSIDIISKKFVFESIHEQVELIPNFIYISKSLNPGVAFGLFQNEGTILLYLIPLMLVGILFYTKTYKGILNKIFMGAIFGGALGNYYDRFFYGEVRDFIDVRFGVHHYPIFNFADSCISVGVVLLLIFNFIDSRKKTEPEDSTTTP